MSGRCQNYCCSHATDRRMHDKSSLKGNVELYRKLFLSFLSFRFSLIESILADFNKCRSVDHKDPIDTLVCLDADHARFSKEEVELWSFQAFYQTSIELAWKGDLGSMKLIHFYMTQRTNQLHQSNAFFKKV